MASASKEVEDLHQELAHAFGNYKAEWLEGRIFDLFQRPSYFAEVEAPAPAFLEGGRGTGKTTVLRCMEYRGQFETGQLEPNQLDKMPYWGIFYRVDTSRVRAFEGGSLSEADWIEVFSHYVNLLLVGKLARMVRWTEELTGNELPLSNGALLSRALCVNECSSWTQLSENLQIALVDLELYVNNLALDERPRVSMARAPLELAIDELKDIAPFQGRTFFVLIDEYENLLDYQQKVLNTYIKHCASPLSYKVAVRPGGLRVTYSLKEDEPLRSPADYAAVPVEERLEADFETFARTVCAQRLHLAGLSLEASTLDAFLPGLTYDDEAKRLGGDSGAEKTAARLREAGTDPEWVGDRNTLELLLLDFWSRNKESDLAECAESMIRDSSEWNTRLNNYVIPVLFSITEGKRGGARRRFYCGLDTFVAMSGTNIRFFCELVHAAIVEHLRNHEDPSQPISPETQTAAAQQVGFKNLGELEKLSSHGGRVKRLILSLAGHRKKRRHGIDRDRNV